VPEPSQADSGLWARYDPLQPAAHEPAAHEPVAHEPVDREPVVHWPAEPEPAQPHVHGVKRWIFVAVLVVVWIPAAAAGVGLYYWWFQSVDKTWPVFVVLIFVGVCTVCALLAAMVNDKPLVSALALALMAAPLAAVAAAAVLHGTYFCDRVGHCLVGLIPY
jgi:peptidoglycan/LPS O-acetylase OafA/YrhL